jgi:hypothetical protein
MRRAYILVYNGDSGGRNEMRDFLEAIPDILNWRYELPSSFYLISEKSAKELANQIRKKTGNKGAFIVAELNENAYGWLDKESWALIQERHLPR